MRKNAFLVDENNNITHTVIGLRMIHDMIEAEYFSNQSIENGCFCSSSVGVSNTGNNRLFIAQKSGHRVTLTQIKEPKTYEELDAVREIVKDFNK